MARQQGFSGELTAAQLGQIKGAGIVLWIYIDLSGNVALSGDLKFFEATGGGFDMGFKLERVNGSLTNTIINTETPANVFAPRFTGKVEATQNIGLALAADLLVAGVRPATVKSTLIGVNATASVEGDGGYRWTPSPAAFEGSLCAHAGIKLVSNIELNVAVNAKLDAGWFSGSRGIQQRFGPAEKVWGEKNYDGCVNTFTLPLVQKGMVADTLDASKTKVEMSFAEAYNNVALRSQVGRWQIFEEGPVQSKFYDADVSFGGLFTVSLPAGSYKFTVVALHKDLKDSMGQALVIATSSAVSVNVTAAPRVDFTWSIIGGDCTKLQLSSTATASGGVLSSYKWTVTPANGVASMQTGASLSVTTFTLGSCGSVSVLHQVTDSRGVSTSLVRSVDTSTLAPTVTSITPATATIGVATSFIVAGTNLPLTAVLSIADGSCSTPTNRTSTGFTVSCTPGGSGAKAVSVLAATGGVVIDATRILTVAASTQLYSFFDSFDGSDIEPTKWTRVLHPTYAGTGATVSAGDLQLRVGAYLHTYGKAVFSGRKIVVESVAGDAEATMLLLDTFNPLTGWSNDVILASDTIYRGWGFDVQTTGRYAIVGPTTAGTITVAEGANVLINSHHKPEMLYRRLTVDGNVVTSERGAGADAITERLSTQMASSMVGRPMTLVVSTGVGPYTPGRFQWIRVTVTP